MSAAIEGTLPDSCPNCAAPLAGPYCSECGQHILDPRPTVRHLVRDAVEELLQWDGKVASSFRLLLSRPGRLTTEYFAGRRARYVSPVKLYLLCSALFFFVNTVVPAPPVRTLANGRKDSGFIAAVSEALFEKPLPVKGDASRGDDRILAVARSLERVKHDPHGFEESVQSAAPKAMFLLVPLIAVLLALAFRRARLYYTQHLVFMLHAQAFCFLTLALYQVHALLPWRRLSSLLLVSMLTADLAYLALAARRVYGLRLASTLARVTLFSIAYLALWLTVLSLTIVIVAMTF